MTQELIANVLGVRREGVTEAARKLANARLIQYRRGRITVHRPGLKGRCCESCQLVGAELDRLLPSNPVALRIDSSCAVIRRASAYVR